MPKFDGTGPEGKGPRTGRGMGKCTDGDNSVQGRRGLGRGQGCGPCFLNRKKNEDSKES